MQSKVEEQQRQYIESAWGTLLQALRQDARQPVPPNLSTDKAARAAIKDKWGSVNKALAEAAQQQVGCGLPGRGGRHAARHLSTSWAAHLAAVHAGCRLAAMSTGAPVLSPTCMFLAPVLLGTPCCRHGRSQMPRCVMLCATL